MVCIIPHSQFYFVITLLLICLEVVTCLSNYKPTALLHVGPHKTGTTYFQSYAVENAAILAKKGYKIWPDLTGAIHKCTRQCKTTHCDTIKSHRYYFKRTKQLTKFFVLWSKCRHFQKVVKKFLLDSSKTGHGVIFSHEEWADDTFFYPQEMKKFISFVAKHFNIQVVMYYRNSVNRYISKYNEMIKGNLYGFNQSLELFSDFYKKANINDECIYYRVVIDNFEKLLKPHKNSSLLLVDFYGVSARRDVDLKSVMLCDVLKIECIYKVGGNTTKSTVETNPSIDTAPLQIAVLFMEYAARKNCSLPKTNQSFVRELYEYDWGGSLKIPSVNIDLSDFANQSMAEDKLLRVKMSEKNFIYRNYSANLENVVRSYSEVDRRVVMSDHLWQDQFKARLSIYINSKKCL